jgi:hypothetical protein
MSISKENYKDVILGLEESIEKGVSDEEGIDLKEIDMGYINRVLQGLKKTKKSLTGKLRNIC